MKLILALVPCLLSITAAEAASLKLTWTPSPDVNVVASYRVQISNTNGLPFVTNSVPVNATNFVFTNAVSGVWYSFTMTSISTNGIEGDPSPPASGMAPRPPIPTLQSTLQSAPTPLGPWTDETNTVWNLSQDDGETSRFYREILVFRGLK